MGIFNKLERNAEPIVIKDLDRYLAFSMRLAEANICIEFTHDYIKRNSYLRDTCNSPRRHGIYPNSKTLRRHVLNECDTVLETTDTRAKYTTKTAFCGWFDN